MSHELYVLVLDGDRPRKVHAPDCAWVAATARQAPTRHELNRRRYELRPRAWSRATVVGTWWHAWATFRRLVHPRLKGSLGHGLRRDYPSQGS